MARQASSVALRRCLAVRSVAAAPLSRSYASHPLLSNAAARELEEESSRSDKREQPTAPAGWSVSHTPGSAKFRLTRTYQDESLEIRCALPEANVSNPDQGSNNNNKVTLIVTKGSEAMRFGLSIEDQELVLDTLAHFKDASVPKDDTPAGEDKRVSQYPGPLIHELEGGFVDTMLNYLDERGVNDDLAVFVTEFAFWVEQQEYENWLANISRFTA